MKCGFCTLPLRWRFAYGCYTISLVWRDALAGLRRISHAVKACVAG